MFGAGKSSLLLGANREYAYEPHTRYMEAFAHSKIVTNPGHAIHGKMCCLGAIPLK